MCRSKDIEIVFGILLVCEALRNENFYVAGLSLEYCAAEFISKSGLSGRVREFLLLIGSRS